MQLIIMMDGHPCLSGLLKSPPIDEQTSLMMNTIRTVIFTHTTRTIRSHRSVDHDGSQIIEAI